MCYDIRFTGKMEEAFMFKYVEYTQLLSVEKVKALYTTVYRNY